MAARTLAANARFATLLALRTCLAVGVDTAEASPVPLCANTLAELNAANIALNINTVLIDFTSFTL
jgi:hypothetical protein